MGTHQVELRDVHRGPPPSRKRLLAPLRYLVIRHPEKTFYDVAMPAIWTGVLFAGYVFVEPKPVLFGDAGLIKFVRDLLIMAVPFMVGALAAVAMGAPGPHLDRRLLGAPLYLDGETLTLRQFVCYLLGYLSFIGLVVLIATVGATVMHDAVLTWTKAQPNVQVAVQMIGVFGLAAALSVLTVTVLWGLYFLTAVVNRKDA